MKAKNDDLIEAALKIQEDIRRAYRLHEEHRPVMLSPAFRRIASMPILTWAIRRRRVPLLGWAWPETVCHCLEQAVQKPTRRRERRSLSSWPHQGNGPVHLDDDVRLAGPIGGTRPRPIFRARRQPTTDRIIVNILGEKVSMTRLIVVSDLFPPPDSALRHPP